MDRKMRNLRLQRIQVDEIWSFVGKKKGKLRPEDDPSRVGEEWTYVALGGPTKLVPCYRVGQRNAWNTQRFIMDLADRLECRVQLSSDMLSHYVGAVEAGFGGDVDFGRQVKSYVATPSGPGRYAPPKVKHTRKFSTVGQPDWDHISTSFVERDNLSMRLGIKRLTRLTLAFSKKIENHRAAVALYMAYYNFCRIHRTLGGTPAQAAGVSSRVWNIGDLVALTP